jgi:hypothetical protein
MTYEQIGAGIIAAAVVAWPKILAAGKFILGKLPSVPPATPGGAAVGYEEAIHNLALVRARLNSTALLGDEKSPQRAAIDTLTLALVAGSDK